MNDRSVMEITEEEAAALRGLGWDPYGFDVPEDLDQGFAHDPQLLSPILQDLRKRVEVAPLILMRFVPKENS